MEDTQLKSMNGKYVEYFLFIRDTFLVLNTLNNPQERQYILNRLTMERVDIFSPFLLLSCLLLCKISVYFSFQPLIESRRAWGEVFKKAYKFWDFYIPLINIGWTQKAFLSTGKCRENVLHKYLETDYYETGYLYFSRVMKISVKS